MITVLDVLQKTTQWLESRGFERSRREAEAILEYALGWKRMDLYLKHHFPLNPEEVDRIRDYLKKRSTGMPLAYVHGSVEFDGLHLKVTPDVLIPRPETEEMVVLISSILDKKGLNQSSIKIWDICTGSGCLAIALKKRYPMAEVYMSDLSSGALEIARLNAHENACEIQSGLGSFLEPFKGQTFDLIVSNPPYLAEHEYPDLDIQVKDFEPKLALVSGDTGLEAYKHFALNLHNFLNPGGLACFEIGYSQSEALKAIFMDNGWKKYWTEKDICQKNRYFLIERE